MGNLLNGFFAISVVALCGLKEISDHIQREAPVAANAATENGPNMTGVILGTIGLITIVYLVRRYR